MLDDCIGGMAITMFTCNNFLEEMLTLMVFQSGGQITTKQRITSDLIEVSALELTAYQLTRRILNQLTVFF